MLLRDFYALLIRLFLGYVFVSSGLCKLTHGEFGQLIGPPLLIDELAKYDLALFGYFVAASQVLAGILVMSQRYSLLGLVMLMPINLSILMVTTSQRWTGTPYVNAFFCVLNSLVLLYEWPTLRVFLRPEKGSLAAPPRVNQWFTAKIAPWGAIGLALGAAVASFYAVLACTWLGAGAFFAAYLGVFQNKHLSRLEQAILALSLLCILCVTLIRWQVLMQVFLVSAGLLVLLLAIRTISAWLNPGRADIFRS
jgi:uncharacterized membrane protein YphA (DoxX/SURF4 family)